MRTEMNDLVDQRPAQLQEVRIRQRSLDGGYEKPPLFEDWDFHRPFYVWAVSATGTTLKPSRRSACSMPPCRSTSGFYFPRSTTIVTIVFATSGASTGTATAAPLYRT